MFNLIINLSAMTAQSLIGYIHKMQIAAKLWNLDPKELEEAKDEYNLVKTDPLAGKRPLNKSNFVKEIFSYGYVNFNGAVPDVDVCALPAIRSGEYAATSIWLTGSGGAGLSLQRTKTYWRVTQNPDTCTH